MNTPINLKIYDDDDNVIAEFETKRLRWGIVEDSVDLIEALNGKSERDQFKAMSGFIQLVFPKLTDELLRMADVNDVKMCFFQIINMVKQIKGAEEKNV